MCVVNDAMTDPITETHRRMAQESFASEGRAAFFTAEKWFARVLMNAPAQGTIPWFYNKVKPRHTRPPPAARQPAT
eukprot:SAG11_NODE_1345_length_5147_cov_3.840729_7_plen_76_part_00